MIDRFFPEIFRIESNVETCCGEWPTVVNIDNGYRADPQTHQLLTAAGSDLQLVDDVVVIDRALQNLPGVCYAT